MGFMAHRAGDVWSRVVEAVVGTGVRFTRILRLELVMLEDLGVVVELELGVVEDLGVVVEMEEEDLAVDAGVTGKTRGVVEGRGWIRMGRAALVGLLGVAFVLWLGVALEGRFVLGLGVALVGVFVLELGVALVGGFVGDSVSLLLAPVGAA